MTTPADFPDWHQPVATTFGQVTLFTGVLLTGGGATPVLDVSQYQSVLIFANASYFSLDFTLDQAATKFVQTLFVDGASGPLAVTGPWLTVTNSGAFNATVTVIATTKALVREINYGGEGTGWRGFTGATAMAAGTKYTLIASSGTIVFGLCSLWVQLSSGTLAKGILEAHQIDGNAIQIWDTNMLLVTSSPVGATDQRMVCIPAGTDQINFSCVVAGATNVVATLCPAA